MDDQNSKFNVPQKIEVVLRYGEPPTVSINGIPIDNLSGIAIETAGDDVDHVTVTLKIHVEANTFVCNVEQTQP